VAIGQRVAKIWQFLIFQYGDRRHFGCLHFQNFNGWKGLEGQTALPYQISWRPFKLLLRYGDLSIFQDGGHRHLGF